MEWGCFLSRKQIIRQLTESGVRHSYLDYSLGDTNASVGHCFEGNKKFLIFHDILYFFIAEHFISFYLFESQRDKGQKEKYFILLIYS